MLHGSLAPSSCATPQSQEGEGPQARAGPLCERRPKKEIWRPSEGWTTARTAQRRRPALGDLRHLQRACPTRATVVVEPAQRAIGSGATHSLDLDDSPDDVREPIKA